MRNRFPGARRLRAVLGLPLLGLLGPTLSAIIDRDANQQSDLWQLTFSTGNLAPTADADGDGFSNSAEAAAGTNPFSAASRPSLLLAAQATDLVRLAWPTIADKRYQVFSAGVLGAPTTWTAAGTFRGAGTDLSLDFATTALTTGFFRIVVDDYDADGDGLSDWEERTIGYDPNRKNTEGYGSASTTDFQKVNSALGATNTVQVVAIDPEMAENWPDAGVVAVRRTGNLNAITVNFTLGGTATAGTDYSGPASGTVNFGLGVDEVWLSYLPVNDAVAEPIETITVTLQAGTGYALGAATTATLNLADTDGGKISPKEAARFLEQASFGATDADIAAVQALGFEGWINDQFTRAPQLHFPLVQQWHDEIYAANPANSVSSTERTEVWWRRALQKDVAADPLRQRVAHAFSQIFVISDRLDTVDGTPRGVATYHDQFLTNAFGNYRDILRGVTLHPTMGFYLSHFRNRKADPARNIYPDENYAREVMQLFSIGLWVLNPDGTRVLDGSGQPIPTYDNTTIANFARVFTGFSYSKKYTTATNLTIIPTTGFYDGNGISWEPMRGFDLYHDLATKTLLNGTVLPARTASSNPDTGAAATADLEAAMDNLLNYPSTGPFISRLLIQRLVTSNPSPAYIGRVSAAFANNGDGVRGDMKAVLKAILLDQEARDPAMLVDSEHGSLREPYLRYVALVRALGGPTSDGRIRGMRNIDSEFLQRPYSSPSVFNFYLPDYQPLGPIKNAGLVGPEFQINNSVTGITAPNRFYSGITGNLNPSGQTDTTQNTVIDLTPWLDDATNAPDVLIARLDRLLAAGTLSPKSLRNVSRAVRRLSDPLGTADPATRTARATDRFRMAVYLVAISPEACVRQ